MSRIRGEGSALFGIQIDHLDLVIRAGGQGARSNHVGDDNKHDQRLRKW